MFIFYFDFNLYFYPMKIGFIMSWIYQDIILTQCCCCIPLHTGAIVIAILDIVGGLTSTFGGIITLISDGDLLLNMISFGAGLILGLLLTAEGVALLFAVFKSNQVAMVVHIVLSMVLIVTYTISSVLFLALGIHGFSFGYGCFVLFVIISIIKVYFMLCILGYYELMKTSED